MALPRPGDLQRERDVLRDRAPLEQLVVLEDDAELATQLRQLAARHAADLLPLDEDASGRGRLVADQQPYQGRLAGAAGADEEAEVTLMDRQIDVAQGLRSVRVDLADAVKGDDWAQRLLRRGRRSFRNRHAHQAAPWGDVFIGSCLGSLLYRGPV